MKAKTKKIELTFTMGIPASGKTHWCENRIMNRKGVCHLQTDSYMFSPHAGPADRETMLKKNLDRELLADYDEVLIDGLFLKLSDLEKVFGLMNDVYYKHIRRVVVRWWLPNIPACKHNDIGRRTVNSGITIENAILERFTSEDLKAMLSKFGIDTEVEIVLHEVERKPEWKVYADNNNIYHDNGKVVSERWSLGGNWCDCWGNDNEVGEDTPERFHTFYKILEDEGFKEDEMEEIFHKVVNEDSDYEYDYYGGSVNYAHYYFHLSTLFETLKDYENSRGARFSKKLGIV